MNPQDQSQPTPPQQPPTPNDFTSSNPTQSPAENVAPQTPVQGASDETSQQAAASFQTAGTPLQVAPIEQPQATYESSVPPVAEQPAQTFEPAQPTQAAQPFQSVESTPVNEPSATQFAQDPTASPVAAPITAQPTAATPSEHPAKPAAKKTALIIAAVVVVGILVGVAGYLILEAL